MIVHVAVDAPLNQPLTYRIPEDMIQNARPGVRVKVPLGKRFSKGVLLGETSLSGDYKVKDISEVMSDPPLGEKTLRWLKWLAQYYLHPPGQVYSLAFAPGTEERKKKSHKKSPTSFEFGEIKQPPTPNEDQQRGITAIAKAIDASKFETFLLHGVTGSGKTEVYLRSIEAVLKAGKQVLVLVPEISLTPQLIRRFVERYGEKVAVIHSHLTPREKADQWWSAVKNEKPILVGARSALFCPLENIGLVIVDEEHEGGFKQEEQLKYNARDAAIMRAQFSSCPVVLGSATPSLESWQNVKSGKYTLVSLPKRVENRPLPIIEVVDLRLEKENRQKESAPVPRPTWLSQKLHEGIATTLENKEQCALFLNRRGFAQFVICSGCGFTESCPHCSVTLTVHKRGSQLVCHYCGFYKPKPSRCTSCTQDEYRSVGLGTETVSEDLRLMFPQARIARADRDEINSREKIESLIDKISNREIDILVGTQMIAKGHDFPNLTLVGALLADIGLHIPDFRSSERTFQLLTQVAGRAGRHEKPGRVIIQTYVPEHPVIQFTLAHDFDGFANQEMAMRKELHYPPFGKLATVRLQGANQDAVSKAADLAHQRLTALKTVNPSYEAIEILGPCEAPLAKLKNKHRFQLLLKGLSAKGMNAYLQHLYANLDWLPSTVKISLDVDPLQFL